MPSLHRESTDSLILYNVTYQLQQKFPCISKLFDSIGGICMALFARYNCILMKFTSCLYCTTFSYKGSHKKTRPSSAVYEVPNVRLSAIYEVPDAITTPTSYETTTSSATECSIWEGHSSTINFDNVAYTSTIPPLHMQQNTGRPPSSN